MSKGLDTVVTIQKTTVGCNLDRTGKFTQVCMKQWLQCYHNAVINMPGTLQRSEMPSTTTICRQMKSLSMTYVTSTGVGGSKLWLQGLIPKCFTDRDDMIHHFCYQLPSDCSHSERPTKPDLLERFKSLCTLNSNMSLHSLSWRRAPKVVFA